MARLRCAGRAAGRHERLGDGRTGSAERRLLDIFLTAVWACSDMLSSQPGIEINGEMLPWVQDYFGECVRVKIVDPARAAILEAAVPKRPGDNFEPYRGKVAYIRPPSGEWKDYWEKKVKALKGKQVRVAAVVRRFDGESIDEGPAHGWAIEMVSVKIVKRRGR